MQKTYIRVEMFYSRYQHWCSITNILIIKNTCSQSKTVKFKKFFLGTTYLIFFIKNHVIISILFFKITYPRKKNVIHNGI